MENFEYIGLEVPLNFDDTTILIDGVEVWFRSIPTFLLRRDLEFENVQI